MRMPADSPTANERLRGEDLERQFRQPSSADRLEGGGGVEVGGAAGSLANRDPEVGLGAERVGLLGLHRLVRMVQHGHDRTGVGERPSDRVGQRTEPAGLADAEPAALELVRCFAQGLHFPDDRDGRRRVGAARDPTERGDRVRAADTVDGDRPCCAGTARVQSFVRGPKMPSTRPASNPSAPRSCWSSPTSSPRSIGAARYTSRSPRR